MNELPVLHDFGALSATAVLGWYAWHTATQTIPNLLLAFRDEMAALRADCAAEREALHAALAEQRREQHADQGQLAEALRELAARLPQS